MGGQGIWVESRELTAGCGWELRRAMDLVSQPNIPKSRIYDIIIESHAKSWFTMGSNIVASSLITRLPD
jgi:hypothetical protein